MAPLFLYKEIHMDLTNYEIKLRDTFQLFLVTDKYINYLKKYDSNVCDNYFENRTHIGIILEINDIFYIAPLTSAGKEYLKVKKYRRIVHQIENGDLGFVRIGNMIPVPLSELSVLIISSLEDKKYKDLLLEQYTYLRKKENHDEIINQANALYRLRYNNDNYFLADIMCNFKLLEEKYHNWAEVTN